MAIYVEREGIESCMAKIAAAIEQLKDAAASVDKSMSNLVRKKPTTSIIIPVAHAKKA